MRIHTFWNNLLRFGGIVTHEKVFIGPHTAQIYISNYCNQNCPWCGTYSPFIINKSKKEVMQRKSNFFMDFSLAKALIDEFSQMGTFRLKIFGDGEPLFHPKIIQIVEYVKKTNMECALSTSGIQLDFKQAEYLAKLGMHFGIGLHAASASTWCRIFNNCS